ncbi:MAG: hypothetical protein AMXMBFR66_07260 [Pseudomonadota bacterium]
MAVPAVPAAAPATPHDGRGRLHTGGRRRRGIVADGLVRWLLGLFARGRPRSPAASAGTRAAAPARPPAAAAAGRPPATAFGQRVPLVDRKGRVAGFELRAPTAWRGRGGSAPESGVAQAAAIVAAARLAAGEGRKILVELAAVLLEHAAVQAQAGAGVMLCWSGAPVAAAAAQALRARGALVGAPDGPPERLAGAGAEVARPDFVVLRAAAGGVETLLLSAQRWREALPQVPLVACGLAGVGEVERLLQAGFTLAGGQLDRRGEAHAARPLGAAAHRICELMNHLALDRDTAVIAQAVRADVALSYRLLRYANSPAIGLARGVDSVEAAVALLGRNELQRWLAVLLLGAAQARPAAAALQEHALARGRLFEALARRRGESRPQALFTLGVMSRLDLLLRVPLAAALEPLRLPEVARAALLQRRGDWAAYLELADALEGEDQVALEAAATPYGDLAAVWAEAEGAWAWAAQVMHTDARR